VEKFAENESFSQVVSRLKAEKKSKLIENLSPLLTPYRSRPASPIGYERKR
jgi:predicted CopG family antitoxin